MRDRIQEVARTYLGTPYHHLARLKHVGIDCVGLVVGVAKELGLFEHDCAVYSRQPDGHTLVEEIGKVCTPLPDCEETQTGDLLIFWFTKPHLPQHIGIRTDHGLLHTYARIGKVVEHRINDFWRDHIHSRFRYPGVE